MPMHDWARIPAGIFHAFHNTWIGDLQKALNAGLLPHDHYALGEQQSGDVGPDVIALHAHDEQADGAPAEADGPSVPIETGSGGGTVALAEKPPGVSLTQDAAEDIHFYLARQRTIVIRHVSGDRVVALIEIVSPANKHARRLLDDFIDKVAAALRDGVHVMIIDPLPHGRFDPDGIHGEVWRRLMAGDFESPAGKPLTLVSYAVRRTVTAFVEPMSVGTQLIDMPLFLTPEHYVPVPLEETYNRAWSGVPQRWRRVIEADT
jgi:hypothetical protein